MSSDSSRTRIDQFFALKKRKSLSPSLKRDKTEKQARIVQGSSPSGKGNLNDYLVSSQDDKPTYATPGGSVALDGSVKRNLALDIFKVSADGRNDQYSRAQFHSPSMPAHMETSQGSSNAGVVANSEHDNLERGGENLELKQFALEHLSLYCSELMSTATSPTKKKLNDHRRHSGSLLLDGENNATNKGNCPPNRLFSEGEMACPDRQSTGIIKNADSFLETIREVDAGSNSIQLQNSLRKCTKLSASKLNVAECPSPSPSLVRARVPETPKSSCGSFIFSPGEEFWNEAIQVADGLADIPINHDAEKVFGASCSEKSKEIVHNVGSNVTYNRESDSLKLHGKLMKNSSKEVSPFPVKHLDFLSEDRNADLNVSTGARVELNMNIGGKQSDHGSVYLKGSRMSNLATSITETCKNDKVLEVQKITSVCALTKRNEHLPNKDTDSIMCDSPVNHTKCLRSNHDHREVDTPLSFVAIKDQLDLSNWLPSEVCRIYRKRGISKLYPWQVECLQVEGVLQRRNLVYCASTSAGKSFVAEILMLRQVISTGKIALLVLPYVSICAEKAEHLEGLLEPLGKQVRSFYGNQGGATLPKDSSVAVCTIEKANCLINRLLEESRLSEIGIIVIDELHMVGDQSRGYLLELMLTKLRYAAGEGNSESGSWESSGTSSRSDPCHSLQIVGMSATMPNVAAVAEWLQAALYQTDFRPVPLEEYIKVGNTIYDKKMDIVRTIPRAADCGGKDPDHIVELCNEVVQEGHSVLIFCSSRKGCESTARHISKFLKKYSISSHNDGEFVDITAAIDALRRCPAGLDPTLEETLPCGVAYHHAGLTVEEREIVETCYRRGLLRILTATSTLAAGVNLPARRVIFRQPRIGCDFIDGTRYRQMAGRAGRTGIDTKGESVLICKADEFKRITGLLNESCPPLQSCLSEDKNGMTHAILEVVAGGIVQTANDIHRYVRCTLLNSTKPFRDVVRSAQDSLRWLCHKKFLEWNEDTKLYNITPLGRASFGSSLCPEESLIVLDDFSRAREGFVLASDLHLVYLVTPINVDVDPDWDLYYGRFMELSSLDQSVGNRVGVSEPFLMRMAHGAPLRTLNKLTTYAKGSTGKFETRPGVANNSSDEQTIRVCKRFYVALILSRLVKEAPITEVCEAFKVVRGMVQALQDNAGRFASMVSVFCERLGWHDLEGLVSKFQSRVSFGVRAEIVELTTIPYVKGSRARALYKAGLRTPLAIAEASIPEIAKALFESSSWSTHGTAQKRLQLGAAKKIKNGARKIVLDKAEEARVAAFSAFKSLGLSVPQVSRPFLPNASEDNPTVNGDANVLPMDDATNLFVSVEQMDHSSSKFPIESKEDFGEVSGTKGDRLTELDVDRAAPVGGLPSGALRSHIVAEGQILTNAKDPLIHSENDACNNKINTATVILSSHLKQNKGHDENIVIELQEACGKGIKDGPSEKGPITVRNAFGGFDSFLDLWSTVQEFFFDIHYNKRSEVNSVIPFEIHGIAICWENSPVYYVNIPKDLLCFDNRSQGFLSAGESGHHSGVESSDNCLEIFRLRWSKIIEIMGKREVRKCTWNLKVQIQVLQCAGVSIHRFSCLNLSGKTLGLEIIDGACALLSPVSVIGAIDLCIVAWILWPDEERSSNPNLDKEVKKRLSTEAIAAANRSGRWKNQTRRAAHNGCCRRVAQSRALYSVLWKLIISERLDDALENIEIPLVNVLANMELCGIGVDMEGCLQARNVLGKKLRHLEKKAYELAGMTFSLYTSADIANVLYRVLKLPVPEGHEGKQHPSTDKHCLDLLRHEHPIVPVIKEHRKLAKLLNCTLGSICSLARLSMRRQKYTLHGHWLQTSTATGRLSMEEPNLQCVEHMVEFEMNVDKDGCDAGPVKYGVNARDFFIPTEENWLLLTADYSQIELRLMAHFSKDASLVEFLSKPHGDVFTMIAARWTGQPEDSISPVERDQTKRLVYGILYGMGANTLSEQLDCSSDEAAQKIKSFKSSFPGVSSWLREAVASCRRKGYIETLKGRKRFLSKIKYGSSEEKSKAQRQAVNSICQGSAADLIKIAMINIHSVITEDVNTPDCSSSLAVKFHMLKGRCRIILQVHDELVLEVDPPVINEAALLLQMCMENAAVLLVPLLVNLKVGRTWGSLEAFKADQSINEISVLGS